MLPAPRTHLRVPLPPLPAHRAVQKKLAILKPLPLFADLQHKEAYKLARMMHLKLVPRYGKVLRAGCVPPAFYVVVWGSLRYATVREDGNAEVVSAGGTFGEGALAAMPAEQSSAKSPKGGGRHQRGSVDVAEPIQSPAAGGRAGAERVQHVPLEPCDLQAAEPTMLLYLKVSDVDLEANPWFASLQRHFVSRQLKSGMLLRVPSMATAGAELAAQLASCFKLYEPPAGTVLYSKGDPPDCAYLIINGAVDIIAKPPEVEAVSSLAPKLEQPEPIVVARRMHTSDCAWVGERALSHKDS